ncbi:hypothetical protein ACMU_00420 [Actibacterium mucosum KCTC 23349]|uniref:Uncharacterized protein n=1 Tax=Actibacterium mucosum KCTC 23349 TaxID=1454373 RepID=A0A037ZMX8_9RHOB|nr:DUF6478 family protein [Actibacterium mucosum]KAJ56990.1 hypothetical protein ACMU_00420 [Actibacterium mucosum KCTC 23349]
MANGFASILDHFVQRVALRRWRRKANRAPVISLSTLRQQRSSARMLRRQLNRVIHQADARLTLPLIGSNSFQKPLGSDWAHRPELWREQLTRQGASAVESATEFGAETKIFHDCNVSELTFRQIRNVREEDLAPFGTSLEVFSFDGSFLSLVVELPDNATEGLTKRHLVRLEAIIELEKPLEIFARLNVKHGPNTEQVVRELPLRDGRTMVEFDLAYTNLNEKRVERMWLDLIFEGPELNQIIIRDLALSRRPRAEL